MQFFALLCLFPIIPYFFNSLIFNFRFLFLLLCLSPEAAGLKRSYVNQDGDFMNAYWFSSFMLCLCCTMHSMCDELKGYRIRNAQYSIKAIAHKKT